MEAQTRVAIVLTGGEAVDPAIASALPGGAYVIAADSGLEQAGRLGLRADVVVGDLDSVRSEVLAAAVAAGCRVDRHPVAKDHTDLELALLAAQAWGAGHVLVVGGHGGRLDHLVANALVLTGSALAGVAVEAWMGPARLHVVRPHQPLAWEGHRGELVTLLAIGGPARGVRTRGLRYPLAGEELRAGSTRGVSNEMAGETAEVTLGEGVLLVIRPSAGLID